MAFERIRNQDLARIAPITREHHEVADGLAANVVIGIGLGDIAHAAVEIGCAQARDHRPASQEFPQQGGIEVAQLELAAQPQELVVAARCRLQATPRLHLDLGGEPRANLVVRQREPGRIEQVEVVREDRRVVTAFQRVIREEHVECSALVEHVDVGDHALEPHVVAIVAVEAVQARGSARFVIGLLLDDEAASSRSNRPRSRTVALVLGAHGTAVS